MGNPRKNKATPERQLTEGGRLHQLVAAGDSQELARRTFTLQSVALDLHRQFATVTSPEELARVLSLALVGSFACERLAVMRCDLEREGYQLVAHTGDVIPAKMNDARSCCQRLAPFLPHQPLLASLEPSFSSESTPASEALLQLGFERVAWLDVEQQVQFVILLGPKMTRLPWDEFDVSMLRASFDAARLACSKLLLVQELEQRNEQLRNVNNRLLQIDDLKSAILAGVSHELRTPLTRILSYAEALRDAGHSKPESDEFLGVIVDNTKKLSGLVDEALGFAQLIGGRTEPRKERVSLHDIVEDVIVRSRPDANNRMMQIDSTCEPHFVLSDPSYILRILRSLLSNALKFTPHGGTIRVDLVAESQGASILIEDSGPGIPQEARDRIWRLFEQGDISLRRETEGLGLGLALAQRLALELGVTLDLVASSDAGSTFRVHFLHALPAIEPPARAEHSAPEAHDNDGDLVPVPVSRSAGKHH